MMTIEVIESWDGFNALRGRWDDLLARSGRPSIFLTWSWLELWLKHYGSACRLCIVAGTDERGHLAALAPLMVRPTRLFGIAARSVEFIGSGEETTPDHLRFIALPGVRDEFARHVFDSLFSRRAAWDMVRLRDTDEDDDFRALVNGAGRAAHDTAGSPVDRCPYISLPKTWNEYVSGLSAKTRYHLKKHESVLREKHGAVFTVVETPEEVAPAMRALEGLHRLRMNDKRLTGSSLDDRFWRFHTEAALMLQPVGRLLISMVTVGEKVIACTYSFMCCGTVSYYQTGLDPAWKAQGAGNALLGFTIRHAIERGMSEFDLMRGDEPYKFHLTKLTRESRTLYVWNDTVRGRVLRAVYRLKALARRCARLIRKEKAPDDTH